MFFENDEGGFQSIYILFSSFILAILYFVWQSTQVREIPTTLPMGNFVRRSSSVISNISTVSASTTEENLAESSVDQITDQIISEASENYRSNENSQRSERDFLTEEEQIIREMDRDLPSTSGESSSLRRRVVAPSTASEPIDQKEEDKISIKLKYISDEIKTVSGYMTESIGNFKRRQFNTELESKLIKLIFNGKCLDDDKKSLSQCGLFEDCVVHCLILQKRNLITPVSNQTPNTPRTHNGNTLLNATGLEWNGTLFIYILGMILVSLTLVFCWYCRIQYASYFSWYSTIGLVLMTSLFLVMIPLLTLVGFFHNHRRP